MLPSMRIFEIKYTIFWSLRLKCSNTSWVHVVTQNETLCRDIFICSKSELRPEAGKLQSEMKNSIVVLQGKSETVSIFVRDTYASVAF